MSAPRHSERPSPLTVLVTGATDGIGKATAHLLAERGATVIVHGRDADKTRAVRHNLPTPAAQQHAEVVFDLASLAAVRRGGAEIHERFANLDVLLNNAGVFVNERRLSIDGLELTMAVNHYAPFLLTALLLPKLRGRPDSRVVNVSSIAHQRGRLPLEDLTFSQDFSGYGVYAASKLANVLFSQELAARLAGGPPVVNSLHPGVITTKLLRAGFNMSGDSVENGARTSVWAALDVQSGGVTGRYFVDSHEVQTGQAAQDAAVQRRLWELSVETTGANFGL